MRGPSTPAAKAIGGVQCLGLEGLILGNDVAVRFSHPGGDLDACNLLAANGGEPGRGGGKLRSRLLPDGRHPVDPVAVGVKRVVHELIPEEQAHEQAHRHSRRQAQHIDGGDAFLLPEGAEGDLEVIAEHRSSG